MSEERKAEEEVKEEVTEEKLLPCPFCGSGELEFEDLGKEGYFEDWCVTCKGCGVCMIAPGEEPGCITTKEEAMEVWNRRAK